MQIHHARRLVDASATDDAREASMETEQSEIARDREALEEQESIGAD